MKISLTFFFIFLFIVSCKNKAGGSGDHLPAKLMQQVMTDINLAESYSIMVKDSTHKGGTKNIDSLAVYYKAIFNHYNITPEQFTESINWYKANPEQLDSMYTNMSRSLAKLQTSPAAAIPAKPIPDTAFMARLKAMKK